MRFKLNATSCTEAELADWWTNPCFGPLPSHPFVQSISLEQDATVTLCVDPADGLAASEAAASVQRHMERTSFRLQQLKCTDCGYEVASPDLSCCRHLTTNSLRISFRVQQSTIESAFGTEERPCVWRSASDASVATWLRLHADAAADGGLPVVLSHSEKARSLQEDVIAWLNSIRPSSAVTCIYSKFLPRPWTVTASSLKCSTATQFIQNVTQTSNAQDFASAPHPLPYHEEFGRLLDSLLKTSIKLASNPDSIRCALESQSNTHTHALSGEWRPSEAAFTPLTICRWQFGNLMACEETDALFGRHIVELKTLPKVEVASGDGDAADVADAAEFGDSQADQMGCSLSDYLRQMAVSSMALHVCHSLDAA
jgi:hypothetical protein